MSPVYDIIFAGGGATACVVAGRLAAASPSLKILVVEGGKHSRDVASHVQPCRYLEHVVPSSTTIYFHTGKPSKHLNGRFAGAISGKGVGGGSVINAMFYTRGAASDYDDWKAFGNTGWGFDDLLPLVKKVETFTPISDQPTHGYSGPILISPRGADLGFGDQYLSVSKLYDPGRPQVDDANDFKTPNAYSPSYRYVDPVTGKRCDAASRYLYPESGNPNLVIVAGKRVRRVIIRNGRATGIEYGTDGMGGSDDEVTVANASKLIVVSAGTFGSPAILERSGVGGASILEKLNIPVLVDLPGVGENFQDHFGARSAYHASDDLDFMKDVWSDPNAYNAQLREWEVHGIGKIALNGVEAMAKVRPSAAELVTAGPALKQRWETFFAPRPDKAMSIMVPFTGCPMAQDQKYVTGEYILLYPDLNGSVHITSGEDANAPLDFEPGYCSAACDMEELGFMYKLTRELFRRTPAFRGEVAIYHPKFPPGSAAACKETNGPIPIDAPNIAYSVEDDEAIATYHRDTAYANSHALGTCAMKAREQGGVVDARLNVYGVEGLKVADLSICPSNIGNNAYSTALVVGEKAAVIIAEDLGLKLQDD